MPRSPESVSRYPRHPRPRTFDHPGALSARLRRLTVVAFTAMTLLALVLGATSAQAAEECCTVVSVVGTSRLVHLRDGANQSFALSARDARILSRLRPGQRLDVQPEPSALQVGQVVSLRLPSGPGQLPPVSFEDCCNVRSTPAPPRIGGAQQHRTSARPTGAAPLSPGQTPSVPGPRRPTSGLTATSVRTIGKSGPTGTGVIIKDPKDIPGGGGAPQGIVTRSFDPCSFASEAASSGSYSAWRWAARSRSKPARA